MKYLFLIIRHLYPRHKWKIIQEVDLYDGVNANPFGTKYILQDQFGNMKEFRSQQ